MTRRLRALANITRSNVLFNVLVEVLPVIFALNQLQGVIDTKVARKRIVVVPPQDLLSCGFRFRYIDSVSETH